MSGHPAARIAAILVVLLAAASPARSDEAGARIYFGAAGAALAGRVDGAGGRPLACAGCHGPLARGGGEGRARIPPIDAAALAGSGAYDLPAFARALTEGLGPDGRRLGVAMPRFTASAEQAAALWRFLGTVGRQEAAGILPDHVTFVVPALPDRLQQAEALREAMERRWRTSGPLVVHGRMVRFVAAAGDDLGHVGGLAAIGPELDAEGRLLDAVRAAGLPVLAPRGASTGRSADVVRIRAGDDAVRARLATLAGEEGGRLTVPEDIAALRDVVGRGASGRVAVSEELARADPGAVAALLARGVEVAVLRPAGDLDDLDAVAGVVAAILERALVEAGRPLTRSGFRAALGRVRVRADGWPAIDLSRDPAAWPEAIEIVRLSRP